MFQFSKLIIFIVLILSVNVFSKESSQAPESSVGGPDKAQQERTKEWMELSSQISAVKSKIKTKEENIKEIIKHKHHAKNKSEAEHAVKNLISEHNELKKLETEYNEKIQLMKYSYPDVGITGKRSYERIKGKSIEDYEKMMGIEADIKKSVIRVKEHYGVKDIEEEQPNPKKNNEEDEDNNYLAKPIIIRK